MSTIDLFKDLHKMIDDGKIEDAKIILLKQSTDIFLFASDIKNQDHAYSVCYVLNSLSLNIRFNINSFIIFSEALYNFKNFSFLINNKYLKQLFIYNKSQFSKLQIKIKKTKPDILIPYISLIYTIYLEDDFDTTHKKLANKLLLTKNISLLKAYINSIGKVNYKDHEKELLNTIKILNKLHNINELYYSLLLAYTNLIQYSSKVSECFLSLKNAPTEEDKVHLIYCLSLLPKKYFKEDWYNEIFFKFDDSLIANHFRLHSIDTILCAKILLSDIIVVEKFLKSLAQKTPIEELKKFDINSVFYNFTTLLHKEPSIAQIIIISMLNDENYSIFIFAIKLLETFQRKDLSYNTFSFDSLYSSKLGSFDYVYISKKIIGQLVEFNILCPLIFSILENMDATDFRRGYITTLFLNYIGYNFPKSTIEFLLKKLIFLDINKPKGKYILSLINSIEENIKPKNSLPFLKELMPDIYISKELNSALDNRQKDIHDLSKQKSVLRQIACQIPIKYGNGMFSYSTFSNDYISPVNMVSFGFSIEQPLSEIYSPITYCIRRNKMLQTKKRI